MKSWGLNPTKQDVQDIMNDIDDSGDGEFDFPEFIEIMATRMKVKDNWSTIFIKSLPSKKTWWAIEYVMPNVLFLEFW